MHDLSMIAAAEWAHTNSAYGKDPVQYGHKVALAYLACEKTWASAGDEKATSAAIAALSIRPEVLQLLSQLASHFDRRTSDELTQTLAAGVAG